MPREKHIFYNIVSDENSFTELFCNLLQYPLFREVFIALIKEKTESSDVFFEYENVLTQFNTENNGIPDILIETDVLTILAENKIDKTRTITENQPISYLEYLNGPECNTKFKILIFILPYDYEKEEIINRKNKFFKQYNVNDIKFGIIYWEELHKRLIESGLIETNQVFSNFNTLLNAWFSTNKISFAEREIEMSYSTEIPTTFLKLTNLVNEVKNKVSKAYKVRPEINNYGHGFYIMDSNGNQILWFGIWYEYWAQHGKPFVIAIENINCIPGSIQKFQMKYGKEVIKYDKDRWYLYGLPEEYLTAQNSIEKVTSFLNELVKTIL